MKKVFVICIAACIGMNFLNAQTFSENARPWDQGRLTWNDFSKKQTPSGRNSELKYFMSYRTVRQKTNDSLLSRVRAEIFVDRDSSWVDVTRMNHWELRYQQLIFDILEYQCRDMQAEIDRCRKPSDLDSCMQRGFDQAAEDILFFQTFSRDGKDTAIILQWEHKMQQLLSRPDNRNYIPAFSPALFGMGAFLGFGSNLYIGNFSEHFSSKGNVSLGFEASFGRTELLLNATLGGSKVKKDSFLIKKERWSKNDHLEFCQLNAALGFRILERAKWQLTPFIGYGITEISTIAGQNDEIKHRERTNGWMGGLSMDYKLRTNLSLTPNYLKSKEYSTISLRARVYVAQADFSDELQGMTINFSLGASVFDQFVNLK